jgi:hypothetical protein
MPSAITSILSADHRPRKKAKLSSSSSSSSSPTALPAHAPPKKKEKKKKSPKPPRAFDLSSRRTRHISLRLSYDGETYGGFSENVGEAYDNSVEKGERGE